MARFAGCAGRLCTDVHRLIGAQRWRHRPRRHGGQKRLGDGGSPVQLTARIDQAVGIDVGKSHLNTVAATVGRHRHHRAVWQASHKRVIGQNAVHHNWSTVGHRFGGGRWSLIDTHDHRSIGKNAKNGVVAFEHRSLQVGRKRGAGAE